MISISIVSHQQINLIECFLRDLSSFSRTIPVQVVLTLNLPEKLPFQINEFTFPITLLSNSSPQGFAANQNQAFKRAAGEFFCVINPDIRLIGNPFPALLDCLQKTSAGLVSPLVMSESGQVEDCARHFPTPLKILCKLLRGCRGSDYDIKETLVYPDWVPGMFMLFPREVFSQLNGFDERFFLYYEDVDLCARLRLLGYEVALCPNAKVIHHAHRSSHRNLKYFRWHLASMMRYFFSAVFVKIFYNKFRRLKY